MTDEKAKAIKLLTRFALGTLALGGVLFVFGIFFLVTTHRSLAWSTVEGDVVKIEVNTHVTQRKAPVSATQTAQPEYYLSTHYTYKVDDLPYFSSRYSFGQGDRASRFYRERSEAQVEASKRSQAATKLTVYYDPEDPSSAVLAPGWNWGTFVPLLLGLFLAGAGWFMFVIIKKGPQPAAQ